MIANSATCVHKKGHKYKDGFQAPGPSAQEGDCQGGGEEGGASIDPPRRTELPAAAKT